MNYISAKEERLGIAAIIPLLVEAGKAGFEAYTGYVENQNLKQQNNSQMAVITAMRNLQSSIPQNQQSNKNLPYIVAGGAALMLLLTQLH